MSRYQLPDGRLVSGDMPFTLTRPVTVPVQQPNGDIVDEIRSDDICFPGARWLTPAEREDLGLVEIVEQPRPIADFATVNEDPDNPGGWIVTPFEPERVKQLLVDRAMAARWNKEVGGITVAGLPVATDDRSKMMLQGARMLAEQDPGFTTPWAAGAQVSTLNASQVIAISDAVAAHVQSCFQTFADVIAAIEAGTITDYAGVEAAFA